MYLSHKSLNLTTHQHYQYTTLFLFVFGFFLFFPFYIFVTEFAVDTNLWQWFFFFPWMSFYIFWCLKERNKVDLNEKIDPLHRPIIHWLLFALCILVLTLQPNDLREMQSLDLAFIIFSFFIADGFWDFKTMKVK